MTTEQQAHELAELRRALHATEQARLELEARLAHAEPVAAAAHALCAIPTSEEDAQSDWERAFDALLAAHRATTPSEVPSSHVIVERARLERLEAIEKRLNASIAEGAVIERSIDDLFWILSGKGVS